MAVSLMKAEEQHILTVLPMLLKKDTRFRTEVYSVLMETFATKDDLKQILDEMRISREETNKRFEAMDKRFDEMREEMNKRFDEIDKRFEASDKRFEAMDKRFEAMNKRFDKMDKRFDKMDKRFEAMDKRFDKIDKRFDDQQDWVGMVVGNLQRRAGRNLEDTIAGTLRVALKRRDVKPESLKLRQKIVDDEGLIAPKGREYEIDIWAHNSETVLFEIKSYAEPEDVLRFNDKVRLATKKLNLTNPSKVFITLEKDRDMAKICEELEVELV